MENKIIKSVSAAIIALSFTTAAQATGSGPYFGLMLGQANYHMKEQSVQIPPQTITLKPPGANLATRLYLGGNFNQYFGLEGGLTYYFMNKWSASGGANSSVKTHALTLDLLGKAMYPIATSGFGVFAKFGFAAVLSKTSGKVNTVSVPSKTTSSIRPALGLGVSYDISQRWVADLSYTRIFIKTTYISNPDYIALGITYHLVDEVCGQFLC